MHVLNTTSKKKHFLFFIVVVAMLQILVTLSANSIYLKNELALSVSAKLYAPM